jgi:hypothetical protein
MATKKKKKKAKKPYKKYYKSYYRQDDTTSSYGVILVKKEDGTSEMVDILGNVVSGPSVGVQRRPGKAV